MEALRQSPEIQMLQVAHDLKSPLTALKILAARAKTLPPDERQMIIQAVGRIQEIVVDVLQPTPAGSAPSSTKSWDLENLRTLMEEKRLEFPKVHFQVEIIANGPFQLKVPAGQMNRVLSNLINNACEANNGQGRVIVRAYTGLGLRLEIEDQGPGIPRDLRGRLGQLGLSKKESFGLRRGIGLYSAIQFANELGGHLTLEPRSEAPGTCVCLDLTKADKKRPVAAV